MNDEDAFGLSRRSLAGRTGTAAEPSGWGFPLRPHVVTYAVGLNPDHSSRMPRSRQTRAAKPKTTRSRPGAKD